tara:strand:- start:530 stop:706 length:177 start_codon:yes stop_codon:yes gene_type:complete
MICPVCNEGILKKYKDIIQKDHVEFEASKCEKCGEELMNMKQLKTLAGKNSLKLIPEA